MEKIKILNSDGKSSKEFEQEINTFLSKGWKLKGNMFFDGVLTQVIVKKRKI